MTQCHNKTIQSPFHVPPLSPVHPPDAIFAHSHVPARLDEHLDRVPGAHHAPVCPPGVPVLPHPPQLLHGVFQLFSGLDKMIKIKTSKLEFVTFGARVGTYIYKHI